MEKPSENELRKRFPNASAAFIKLNAQTAGVRDRLQDPQQKPHPGQRGQGTHPRKDQGPPSRRILVRITSLRTRLLDEDNLYVNSVVNALRHEGIIPDDDPRTVKIQVRQAQVLARDEERTIIEVQFP